MFGKRILVSDQDTGTVTDVEAIGDRAVITATDNGSGIPDALKNTLFERFARGDSSRFRGTGSTGLGLAIMAAVVAAHHGEVSVESGPGQTTFRVALPLA